MRAFRSVSTISPQEGRGRPANTLMLSVTIRVAPKEAVDQHVRSVPKIGKRRTADAEDAVVKIVQIAQSDLEAARAR